MLKRIFIIVFIALSLCFFIGIIAPSFVDLNKYKNRAVNEFHKYTGLDLSLDGDIEFSLFPSPKFVVNDVFLASPEGSKESKLASFERLDVNIDLMPLFKGLVAVNSITIVKPFIAVEKMQNGSFNAITSQLQEYLSKGSDSPSSIPEISLNEIRIKDGAFAYYDHKSNNNISIQNINVDLSADTLLGPFEAQGSLFYDGNALNFELSSDAYDSKNKILSSKAEFTLLPSNLILEYAGVINFADGFSLQGQTTARIKNVNKLLPTDFDAPLEIEGMLTSTIKKIDYKDFNMRLKGEEWSGSLSLNFAPLEYSLSLKSKGSIVLKNLLQKDLPFETVSLDLNIAGDAALTKISNSTIKLDDNIFKVSGKYKNNNETPRSFIKLDIKSDNVSYDKNVLKNDSKLSAKLSEQDIRKISSSLALPVNLDITLSIAKLIWQEKEVADIYLSTKLRPNSLKISSLRLGSVAGANIEVSGEIKDLKNLAKITSYVEINAKDIKKFVHFLGGEDTSSWPDQMGKTNIKARFTGSIDAMDMTANILAMGGEIIAGGKINSPIENLSMEDIKLQLKHKNAAQFIGIFANADIGADMSLSSPLDIYMEIKQSGSRYSLNEIKGVVSDIAVQGNLAIDLSKKKPKIKGALELGGVVVSSSNKQQSNNNATARWSKEHIDTSPFHVINTDISLKAKRISYGAWSLIKPSLKLHMNEGVLKISDLRAGLFGGSISMDSRIKSVPKPRQPIYFESNIIVENADLKRLSKAMLGTQVIKISGIGNLNMSLKSSGASPAALVHDLNGKGSITGADIILDGIDINRFARALSEESKPSDTISGLWKGASKGGKSAFDTLDGAFVINQGVVQIDKMTLDGAASLIETKGSINLPNWTLATKHKITVKGSDIAPSDVPPFEISFNGSLDNPAQTFGQGLLDDYLKRKIQRKLNKLLLDKLGAPANDNKDQTSQQQQNVAPAPSAEDEIEKVIKGVLGDLLR